MTKRTTDAVASTGRPPNAFLVWVDDLWLFMEIPSKDGGVPYISKFARTGAGLAKALSIMTTAQKAVGKARYAIAKQPKITRRRFQQDQFTPQAEERMADIIRRFKGPLH